MNKLLIYFRQALHMMKEEKLFSGIYIAGTALAIAFTMVIAVVYYAKLADIEPEVNRSRTVYVLGMRMTYKDGSSDDWTRDYYDPTKVKEWLYPLKSAEFVSAIIDPGTFVRDKFYVTSDDGRIVSGVLKLVDANFFKVYHYKFVYGRPFTQEEVFCEGGDPDASKAVGIISKDIAEKVFGKGVNPVGKTVNFGYDIRIVGVIEPTSSIMSESFGQLFIPNNEGAYKAIVVLKEGCTIDDLRRELDEIAHKRTISNDKWKYDFEGSVQPHAQRMMSEGEELSSWKEILVSLFPQVLVLLLIPALNLSGLVAARMKRRLPEMGVRKAFGAKRRELLHQVISENLVLTLCGGAVGLVITWLLLYVFRSWVFFAIGNNTYTLPEPMVEGEMLFSPLIFLIAFVVCAVVNLMSSLIPAWMSLRNPIVESLNQKR